MARINIYLPDDLHDTVKNARLPVSAICRKALEDALRDGIDELDLTEDGKPVVALRPAGDDEAQYQRGRDFGARWAVAARTEELDAVLVWSRVRWHGFSLDPAGHSLPYAHARELGLPGPEAGRRYWIERNAFAAGMLDGIAGQALHRTAV